MKTKYTIYVGRFCVARFEAASLAEATSRWNKIADELKKAGTCTLYQGPRGVANMCSQQTITDRPARAKGGAARWKGMSKAERSTEMKRVRGASA